MMKKWDTPFAANLFPAVEIFVGGNPGALVLRVSASMSWEVRFSEVLALKVVAEEWDDNRRFCAIECDTAKVCSYRQDPSPWLNEIDRGRWEGIAKKQLSHFVLLGGDHNVEVIATEPSISVIQEIAG